MNTTLKVAFTLTTALFFTTMTQPAQAQDPDAGVDRFDRLDTNADGTLSRDEVAAGRLETRRGRGPGRLHRGPRTALLQRADADGNKAVSLTEWHAFVDQLDADGNGSIDRDERAAMRPEHARDRTAGLERRAERDHVEARTTDEMLAMFTRLDRNDDGVIDAEDRPRRRHARRAHVRGGRHQRMGRDLIRAADADANEEVTRDEWKGFLQGVDTDGDGTLSRAEIVTHAAARREPVAQGPTLDELESRFDTLDADGDGVLRGDELKRHPRRHAE